MVVDQGLLNQVEMVVNGTFDIFDSFDKELLVFFNLV
jgi:hypothetical protein